VAKTESNFNRFEYFVVYTIEHNIGIAFKKYITLIIIIRIYNDNLQFRFLKEKTFLSRTQVLNNITNNTNILIILTLKNIVQRIFFSVDFYYFHIQFM